MPYPVPLRDAARLDALRSLHVLDTPRELACEDVAQLASVLCRTPIAVVNFVDAERQWGKALVGMSSSEAPREHSFCARTILAEDGVMVVPDTRADPAWASNPMVSEYGIGSYAGAAVVTADGHALGTVCVADTRARGYTPRMLEGLRALARQTAALLDLRRTTGWLVQANEELHRVRVQDRLTGLAGSGEIHDRLGQALRTRVRTGRDVGLVLCDLAGFSAVNARFGHQGGDEFLRVVAGRVAAQARASDTVARLAGDQFVALCPGLSAAEDVIAVVERLRAAVEQPLAIAGVPITPRTSIAAVIARPGEDAAAVVRRATAATAMVKARR